MHSDTLARILVSQMQLWILVAIGGSSIFPYLLWSSHGQAPPEGIGVITSLAEVQVNLFVKAECVNRKKPLVWYKRTSHKCDAI